MGDRPFLRVGLPFLGCTVAASFALAYLRQDRYERVTARSNPTDMAVKAAQRRQGGELDPVFLNPMFLTTVTGKREFDPEVERQRILEQTDLEYVIRPIPGKPTFGHGAPAPAGTVADSPRPANPAPETPAGPPEASSAPARAPPPPS
eukprot:tig00000865_g5070.t1